MSMRDAAVEYERCCCRVWEMLLSSMRDVAVELSVVSSKSIKIGHFFCTLLLTDFEFVNKSIKQICSSSLHILIGHVHFKCKKSKSISLVLKKKLSTKAFILWIIRKMYFHMFLLIFTDFVFWDLKKNQVDVNFFKNFYVEMEILNYYKWMWIYKNKIFFQDIACIILPDCFFLF